MKLSVYISEHKFIYAFLNVLSIIAFIFSFSIPIVLWPELGIIKKALIIVLFLGIFFVIMAIMSNLIEKAFDALHKAKGEKTYKEIKDEIDNELIRQREASNTLENRIIRIENSSRLIVSLLVILFLIELLDKIDLSNEINAIKAFIIKVATYLGIR